MVSGSRARSTGALPLHALSSSLRSSPTLSSNPPSRLLSLLSSPFSPTLPPSSLLPPPALMRSKAAEVRARGAGQGG